MDALNPNAKGTAEQFLANAPEEAKEAIQAEETQEPEVKAEKSVLELLREDFPNAPSQAQVDSWRQAFGDVQVFVPNKDRFFVFRPLRRIEYSNIAQGIAKFRNTSAAQADPTLVDKQLHERVIGACILAPSDLVSNPEKLNMVPAGLFPTLFELIMAASMFMTPESAMSSTYKL